MTENPGGEEEGSGGTGERPDSVTFNVTIWVNVDTRRSCISPNLLYYDRHFRDVWGSFCCGTVSNFQPKIPKQLFSLPRCKTAYRYFWSRGQLFSGHFSRLRRLICEGRFWLLVESKPVELRTDLIRRRGGENGCGPGAGTGSQQVSWRKLGWAGGLCPGRRRAVG